MPETATLLEVRRTDRTVIFFWDDQPTGFERMKAEEANPANGQRIGTLGRVIVTTAHRAHTA